MPRPGPKPMTSRTHSFDPPTPRPTLGFAQEAVLADLCARFREAERPLEPLLAGPEGASGPPSCWGPPGLGIGSTLMVPFSKRWPSPVR